MFFVTGYKRFIGFDLAEEVLWLAVSTGLGWFRDFGFQLEGVELPGNESLGFRVLECLGL